VVRNVPRRGFRLRVAQGLFPTGAHGYRSGPSLAIRIAARSIDAMYPVRTGPRCPQAHSWAHRLTGSQAHRLTGSQLGSQLGSQAHRLTAGLTAGLTGPQAHSWARFRLRKRPRSAAACAEFRQCSRRSTSSACARCSSRQGLHMCMISHLSRHPYPTPWPTSARSAGNHDWHCAYRLHAAAHPFSSHLYGSILSPLTDAQKPPFSLTEERRLEAALAKRACVCTAQPRALHVRAAAHRSAATLVWLHCCGARADRSRPLTRRLRSAD
jgi:hypothetical protein